MKKMLTLALVLTLALALIGCSNTEKTIKCTAVTYQNGEWAYTQFGDEMAKWVHVAYTNEDGVEVYTPYMVDGYFDGDTLYDCEWVKINRNDTYVIPVTVDVYADNAVIVRYPNLTVFFDYEGEKVPVDEIKAYGTYSRNIGNWGDTILAIKVEEKELPLYHEFDKSDMWCPTGPVDSPREVTGILFEGHHMALLRGAIDN